MMRSLTFFFVAALGLIFFYESADAVSLRKKIVIYHSYPPGEWYHGINGAFEQTLGQLGIQAEIIPVVFHSEFWFRKPMDEQAKERIRLLDIARTNNPDLVVLCDDEANNFLALDINKLGFPILFTGVNEAMDRIQWLPHISKKSIAGVFENYQISEAIELLKKLRPEIKSMSILTSKNQSSEIISQEISKEMSSPEFKRLHGIKLRSVNTLRYWEEWKKITPELNQKDQALWILVPYDVRDSNNQEVPISQIGSWLSRHLDIPTLGIVSIHTKIGLLAAISLSPEALGRQSGEQAARFFQGESLEKIGFEKSRYHKMEINMNESKRLGIQIPKDLLGIASFVDSPFLKYGR